MKSKIIVNLFLVFIFGSLFTGCVSESNFRLSDESRLPKWFEISGGENRKGFYVTLHYYTSPSGGSAALNLYENDKFFKIDKISAKQEQLQPIQLKNPPKGSAKGYPLYEIIEFDGIVDIIEHRRMEPVFYMVDDPVIWKELGVEKK